MTNNSVVLINTFEVPKGDEGLFVRRWEEAHDFLLAQDGYLSSQLHQSISPGGRARFVDVAAWASQAALQQAISRPEFLSMGLAYGPVSSLYQLVHADQHWDAQLAARRALVAAAA